MLTGGKMNLNELIKEIYSLGFETEGEATPSVLSAISRSLYLLFTDLPQKRTVRLLPNVPRGTRIFKSYVHTPNAKDGFGICGMAFSFKASGMGEALVEDSLGSRTYEFNSHYSEIRGFISGEAKITFTGPMGYTVSELAVFDTAVSPEEGKIPLYDEYIRIPMSEAAPDFFFFTELPRRADGAFIYQTRIDGDCILLPMDYSGELTVTYARRPTPIDPDRPDDSLDLPSVAAHLLPLLAASYVWLEDDGERSAYYASLYRDGIARIRNEQRMTRSAAFTDVTGWA